MIGCCDFLAQTPDSRITYRVWGSFALVVWLVASWNLICSLVGYANYPGMIYMPSSVLNMRKRLRAFMSLFPCAHDTFAENRNSFCSEVLFSVNSFAAK